MTTRQPGRPRDSRVDDAVLQAASEVLLRDGYAGLQMEAVAAGAGVAKTTVYRRWPSKDHLVLAVLERGQRQVGTPETGDVRADLRELATRLAAVLAEPPTRGLAAELVAMATRSPELGERVQALWASRRREVAAVIERASARGAIRADVSPAVLVDQLAGALYYRALITGDPLTADYAADLVDAVLDGARPSRSTP